MQSAPTLKRRTDDSHVNTLNQARRKDLSDCRVPGSGLGGGSGLAFKHTFRWGAAADAPVDRTAAMSLPCYTTLSYTNIMQALVEMPQFGGLWEHNTRLTQAVGG